jgi:hypothetical protein
MLIFINKYTIISWCDGKIAALLYTFDLSAGLWGLILNPNAFRRVQSGWAKKIKPHALGFPVALILCIIFKSFLKLIVICQSERFPMLYDNGLYYEQCGIAWLRLYQP